MHDVSVVGPLNIDLLIRGDGPPDWDAIPTWEGPADIEMAAAGSVGYTVQNLARLGVSVQVCSCLPDDALGGFVQDALKRANVDTTLVTQMTKTVGGIGAYLLLFGSRKRPLAYRMPTHPLWPLSFDNETQRRLLDARAFHSGGYLHFREAWHGALCDIYHTARERGLLTTMDPQFPLVGLEVPWLPALEDVLPYVDILLCDQHEACGLTGLDDLTAAGRRLLDAGAGTVIIKQGAEGSLAFRGARVISQPAIVVGELVDTIGAGDTYDAGIVYGTLQGWPLERCMRFASAAAGYSVTGAGGSASMPSLETLLEYIRD